MRAACHRVVPSIKGASGAGEAHVGPLASRHAVAGETRQPDITEDNRTSSGHIRAYSGHIRAYPSIVGHEKLVACRIVCRWSRRPGWPVAARRVRRRIACGMARRVRYRLWSVTALRMVVACGIVRRRIACRRARRRIASRHVPARFGDQDVPAVPTVGHPEGPSSAMPRPNSACNRRRYRRFTNIYSFVVPWRFIMAPSAAMIIACRRARREG